MFRLFIKVEVVVVIVVKRDFNIINSFDFAKKIIVIMVAFINPVSTITKTIAFTTATYSTYTFISFTNVFRPKVFVFTIFIVFSFPYTHLILLYSIQVPFQSRIL